MAIREEQIRAYNARQATQQTAQPQMQQAQPTKQGGMTAERRAEIEAMLSQQSQPAPQKPGMFQNVVQSIASPFLKTATSAANTLEGVGNLAQAGFSALTGDQEATQRNINEANAATTKQRDFGYFGQDVSAVGQDNGQFKDTAGFAKDVIGTGAEIGSYFAPAAGVLKGARAAATAGVRPALGTAIADQALINTVGGAIGSAGSEMQKEGSTVGSTLRSGLAGGATGAVLGAALPIAGAAIRGVGRGVSTLGAEVLGKTTGAGEGAIREVFSNPAVIKYARGKSGTPEELMKSALESARSGLDNMTSANSKEYTQAMAKIKASPQDLSQAVSDIRSQIAQDAADSFGIRFTDGKKLNNLDFNASDVVEGTSSVQRAFDRMFGEPITSVADLDRLKKSLGRIANGAPARSPAQALIYKMKDSVSTALKEKVPGYAEEMARFSSAADLSDEIQRALSLGDGASIDTATRKLMSTMRQNNEVRLGFLKALEGKTGEDVTGKIAGATLASKTPRGLVGSLAGFSGGAGALYSLFNPASIPLFLTMLASSSPRFVAEAINILSKVKGTSIPVPVKQQLRNLLIQATAQPSSEVSTEDQPLPQSQP